MQKCCYYIIYSEGLATTAGSSYCKCKRITLQFTTEKRTISQYDFSMYFQWQIQLNKWTTCQGEAGIAMYLVKA